MRVKMHFFFSKCKQSPQFSMHFLRRTFFFFVHRCVALTQRMELDMTTWMPVLRKWMIFEFLLRGHDACNYFLYSDSWHFFSIKTETKTNESIGFGVCVCVFFDSFFIIISGINITIHMDMTSLDILGTFNRSASI